MITILTLLWIGTGLAGVLHAHYVIRREMHKKYGKRYPMNSPLFDEVSIILFIICSFVGPICFITTLIAFPRSFFK
jgi:uncharacterized membrane protein